MRIAIISDIHGNLSALDSVLTKIDKSSPDSIICLGDVSASGPKPRECLNRLLSRSIPIIMGNKDEIFLTEPQEKKTQDEDMRRITEIDEWCSSKLTQEDLTGIKQFKKMISLSVGEGTILCYHGSPRSNKELITSKTPDQELDATFSGAQGETMVGGHTHIQMLRSFRNLTMINPGSVGQAIERIPGETSVRRVPWAEYAILSMEASGDVSGIEFSRVPLDLKEMLAHARESGMPHADWWADRK